MVAVGPKPVVLDRTAQNALRRLRTLRDERDALSDKIKTEEGKIRAAMGDAEEATVKGQVVVTWKRSIRQSLSQTLLKKGYPEIANECMVQSEVRTFKVVDQ